MYTAADRYKDTPEAGMPHAFKQRPDEPTIFPSAFDKFYSGEMQPTFRLKDLDGRLSIFEQETLKEENS